jgi:subtilase family serine protease
MKTGRDQTNGTTYVHEGAKDYYLEIGAANIQSYNIKIEYDSSAIPEYSTVAVVIALVLISISVIAVRKKLRTKR